MTKSALPVSTVLPERAARILREAAQTENTRADPHARAKAIDRATARIKREYPDYFRHDDNEVITP